jgi:DNA repair protein RadC
MADGADKAENHGTGHRLHLRARLLEQGGDTLLDHELIEYLLALAIPRKETKPLAKELLTQYGGLSALLTADSENIAR